MATTVTNQSSTSYTLAGSSEVFTATSNENAITLQDLQGINITKSANVNTFSNGSIITYTITITNNSGQFFTGVRVIDDLGDGKLAYVVSSARLTTGTLTYPVNPVSISPLTFTLQQLNVGQTMTLTYNAQVVFNLPLTTTSITNSVEAIGYTSAGTITGFTSETVQRTGGGGLVLNKTASRTTVLPNQVISYILSLTNNSTEEATALSTTDQLPANFVVTGVSLKIGSGATIQLDATDYTISASNLLTIPSSSGPIITVPAGGTTVITISGYFS